MVSIILTSYNHGEYIAESIRSALKQTYTNFELIIADDCSTDNSWDVIKSFNNSRIKTVRFAENMSSRKWPLLLADYICPESKYIAIHHSDDLWTADKLEKQVAYLEAHPDVEACFTHVQYIDESGSFYEPPVGHPYKHAFDQPNRTRQEWLRHFFEKGNSLCHPSLLIRRDAYEKYGLLTTGLYQVPDYCQWIRLCRHAEIHILREKLTYFRLRSGEQTQNSADTSEKRVRGSIEAFFLPREFENITDPVDFFAVFPDAAEYCSKNNFYAPYVFARVLMSQKNKSKWLYGAQLMYTLLNDRNSKSILEKQYGYTHSSFVQATSAVDVFSAVDETNFINITLNVSEKEMKKRIASSKVYVSRDLHFFASYRIPEAYYDSDVTMSITVFDEFLRDISGVGIELDGVLASFTIEEDIYSGSRNYIIDCVQAVKEITIHGMVDEALPFRKVIAQDRALIETLKMSRKVRNIYIYGAGVIAKRFATLMLKHEIEFAGFVVSDDQVLDEAELFGRPVVYMKDNMSDTEDCGIILALSKEHHESIKATLISCGFNKIVEV